MNTPKTILFALSAAAGLMLAACGGASAPAASPTSAPATANPPAATAQPAQATSAPAPTKPAPTAQPAPTSAPSALTGAPNDILIAAMRKQLKSGPYRSKTTITSNNVATKVTGEIVPPDKMHVISDLGSQTMEQIFIGDKAWMKTGGVWKASPIAGGQIMAQLTDSFISDFAGTISDVKLVGPEALDGAPTMVFTFNSDLNKSTTMKMDSKTSNKVWIRVSDGLVVKQEIDGVAMGVSSHTVQTVEYDPSIKIEPPVK